MHTTPAVEPAVDMDATAQHPTRLTHIRHNGRILCSGEEVTGKTNLDDSRELHYARMSNCAACVEAAEGITRTQVLLKKTAIK